MEQSSKLLHGHISGGDTHSHNRQGGLDSYFLRLSIHNQVQSNANGQATNTTSSSLGSLVAATLADQHSHQATTPGDNKGPLSTPSTPQIQITSSSSGSGAKNQDSASSTSNNTNGLVNGFFLQVPQPDLSKLAIMPNN